MKVMRLDISLVKDAVGTNTLAVHCRSYGAILYLESSVNQADSSVDQADSSVNQTDSVNVPSCPGGGGNEGGPQALA